MKNYDVVIVGAGAAGLFLCRELSKAKKTVLLIDSKKDIFNFSFKTLGSFINLERFNLSEKVVAQKINHLVIASNTVSNSIKTIAYTLDKEELHKEMYSQIDHNYVTILFDTKITSIQKETNNSFTAIKDKSGNKYSGKVFVDASGTQGILSKQLKLVEKKPTLATGVEYNVKYKGDINTMYLLLGKDYKGGYGWIFPLKNNRAIIGFGSIKKEVIKELKPRLHKILELKSIKKLVEKDNNNVEGGSIPITPVIHKFVIHNLVCVGDSVSQVNPIVGEGYKFIFEAAEMAGKAIVKALNTNDLRELKEYENNWESRFLENYQRSKKAQQTIFKMSSSNFAINTGLLLSKLRSNDSNLKSLSGEYDLSKL
jgi:digeranylgeranylglycerophospholipid reductase